MIQLTAMQAEGTILLTMRLHQLHRDYRGDDLGCRCAARYAGTHAEHVAREVMLALGWKP